MVMVPRYRMLQRTFTIALLSLMAGASASAQFIDRFGGDSLSRDPSGVNGWTFFTGDGSAVMDFSPSGREYASIRVDATKDKRNIWWALIRRRVSAHMDLNLLDKPGYALRIETQIRSSHAPRRVNLHLNTQRTTDFHTHLMEFDIPDTSTWHTISMTTRHFDAVPGDSVYGQLALMDWGLEKYTVDIRYFRVDVVRLDSAGPDLGVQVPYHPPVPDTRTFAHHLPVAEDATIDSEYPDVKFNNLSGVDETGRTILITVNGTQSVILRWDLSAYGGMNVEGSGLLDLTTYSLQRLTEQTKDFGMVRIVEIIAGDPAWKEEEVTCATFSRSRPLAAVFNSQMIIDIDVNERRGDRNLATIPAPVLQRLLDGRTLGLALRPLGAVCASFFAREHQGGTRGAILHLSLQPRSSAPVRREK
jgi:hypothetical protein